MGTARQVIECRYCRRLIEAVGGETIVPVHLDYRSQTCSGSGQNGFVCTHIVPEEVELIFTGDWRKPIMLDLNHPL